MSIMSHDVVREPCYWRSLREELSVGKRVNSVRSIAIKNIMLVKH